MVCSSHTWLEGRKTNRNNVVSYFRGLAVQAIKLAYLSSDTFFTNTFNEC
jgi:hypothetical protein